MTVNNFPSFQNQTVGLLVVDCGLDKAIQDSESHWIRLWQKGLYVQLANDAERSIVVLFLGPHAGIGADRGV